MEKNSIRKVWENSMSKCLSKFKNTPRKGKIEKISKNNKKKNWNQSKINLSVGY